MSGISNRIIRSDYTSDTLRAKLSMCGSRTQAGHWVWCRSPACDRCRRYRARCVGNATEAWAGEIVGIHRIMRIDATTIRCDTPGKMLDEVRQTRRGMRRAYAYRAGTDDRWATTQQYATWAPAWDGTHWTAEIRGIVYLGGVGEIRYLDDLGDTYGIRLSSFPRCVLPRDIRQHMCWSFSSTHSIRSCDALSLSSAYNTIDIHGGHKALVSRRGMQASAQ